jgi:hypothetical protein
MNFNTAIDLRFTMDSYVNARLTDYQNLLKTADASSTADAAATYGVSSAIGAVENVINSTKGLSKIVAAAKEAIKAGDDEFNFNNFKQILTDVENHNDGSSDDGCSDDGSYYSSSDDDDYTLRDDQEPLNDESYLSSDISTLSDDRVDDDDDDDSLYDVTDISEGSDACGDSFKSYRS